jgi:hypothetical protein
MAALLGLAMLVAVAQTDDVNALAAEAGVDVQELIAASDTVAVTPRVYLLTTAPHAPVPPTRDWIDSLLTCLAWHESRHTPTAVNPRSGASGYLQFLPSTFRQTPPGRRGESIFSVAAQLEAGRWMINQGRLKEWAVWRMCA